MRKEHRETRPVFGRDVFLTGEYLQHFNPESKQNPFRRIYGKKKEDTINIINETRNTKTILDIGGGMGRISAVLAKSSQNRIILGDISIDMLNLSQQRETSLNNMRLVNADAQRLPFCNNAFEYVVGLDIFCHLQNPERALAEFHRVLRPSGVLILDSTNSNPLWALFYPRYLGKNPLNWLKILKFNGVYPGWQEIVRHYPKKKFLSLLDGIGFRIKKILTYGPIICPKWHLAVATKA
jgi:ubiquinone/menaquinone biosynthesis C-methylase UbiE